MKCPALLMRFCECQSADAGLAAYVRHDVAMVSWKGETAASRGFDAAFGELISECLGRGRLSHQGRDFRFALADPSSDEPSLVLLCGSAG
jgi:hypothetical protein